MSNLEILEKKVEGKKNPTRATTDDIIMNGTDKVVDEIQRVYRLVNNTTKRIEKQNQYIEDKINIVLGLLKYKNIDTEDIKKLQEIEELEHKLKKLRGE